MDTFKVSDVLEMALELEKNGEAFYRAAAKKAQSPAVQALFEDLADQEVLHHATFEKLSKASGDRHLMPSGAWDQYLLYLDATIESALFRGMDKALGLADSVTDEREALRMAIGFEKETLLFFHDLRDMVPATEQDVIERIIAEEKSHLRRLAGLL